MPRIFDNIALDLLPALRETLEISERSDFCVGYFNLRGWKAIDGLIEKWAGGEGSQCRLLVGMQRLAQDELRLAYTLLPGEDQISQQAVIRLKRRLAEEFRTQLTIGAPTDADEAGLRRLSAQLKAKKVVVKLFLRHTLHAKLYLCFRPDPNNPVTGFLGSSNLTLSGLSHQGELNVDVLDHDATAKLAQWFKDRWEDRWCVDITKELIQVIDESWARPECPPPYQIYVKMAYHLAEEARAGLSEFTIPADMRGILLEFQSAAVRIAARHLEKRGGVILGDVVGLGKTLMATALARVFQDPPRSLETLILCPKNLVGMWEEYAHRYRLIAKVVSVTQAQNSLPDLRRYRVVILDESHNLATQGISAISSVIRNEGLRNHLLNNCRTKFFFGNDCPETTAYFEYIGGIEDRMVETLGFQPAPAPPRFRLPNHAFAPPQGLVMTSAGLTQNRYPRFRGADLGSLPNGSALVVQKGRELTLYEKDPADYALAPSEMHENMCL